MQNHPDKFEYLEECLYCGSRDFNDFISAPDRFSKRDEIFNAVKCSKCKLVFQNPRVKEEFIGEYYGDDDDLGYYHVPKEKPKTLFSRIKNFTNQHTLIEHLGYSHLGKKNFFYRLTTLPFKRFSKIRSIPNFVSNGELLEIGCSHGELLVKMKNLGWGVTGIEMNEKMAEHARNIGVYVVAGRIEDADYKNESFDAVVTNMVLEHLHDPLGNLVRVTNWLKPSGQLIFSIPYINGIEFKIFKEYTYALQLPHHITFFNKKIIRKYLTKLGFRDIRFYFQFFDRDIVTSAQWKFAEKGGFMNKLLGHNKIVRYILIKPTLFLLSLFQLTGRVTVHARKK